MMTVIPLNTFAILFRAAVLPKITIFAFATGDATSIGAIGKWVATTWLTFKHGITVTEYLIGATRRSSCYTECCAGAHGCGGGALIDSDTVSIII